MTSKTLLPILLVVTYGQLYQVSTSSNTLLGRGSEKAINERGNQCLPLCPTVVTYHHEVESIPLGKVSRES